MSFFARYEKLCADRGYEASSQAAADALGTNRGTISAWRTSGSTPKMRFLIAIADAYQVSVDYLLERTDDPTDYASLDPRSIAEKVKNLSDDTESDSDDVPINLYCQLDEIDRIKVDAFMQGLLSQDKYTKRMRA